MEAVVCKFGGPSLADAERIRNVRDILRLDPRRRFVVVSAPGKRDRGDRNKITDLLYLCHNLAGQGLDIGEPFKLIRDSYLEIAAGLEVDLDVEGLLAELERRIREGASQDFVASRGEYLCARIVADFFGARFVEAADCVAIDEEGSVEERSYQSLAAALSGEGLFVIPGFYGAGPDGQIKTFSRGGADITGAIVARAVGAAVYENWTDVPGFFMSDPNIVVNPKPIRYVTYREIRELTYIGVNVFHEDAIFPVSRERIPINIRNIRYPKDPGTMIGQQRDTKDRMVVGVAGKKGYSILFVEKLLMNREVGFGRRLFGILEAHGISFEHAPTGIDNISVLINDNQLGGKAERVLEDVRKQLEPDRAEISSGFALIATVGEGMAYRPGVAARLFTALANEGINIRLIDQSSSETSIIVGVETADFDNALRAIYQAFC
jgi:aspartate kinase